MTRSRHAAGDGSATDREPARTAQRDLMYMSEYLTLLTYALYRRYTAGLKGDLW